jgi:hypothetical protein
MGSKADFYVGRGYEAVWLGSIAWDGQPEDLPLELRTATEEESYTNFINKFLSTRGDAATPDNGWPWTWANSSNTNYSYAFDKGRVWVSCFGSSWFKASEEEPDHRTLTSKAAKFPDMSLAPKMQVEGDSRTSNRVFVVKKKNKPTHPLNVRGRVD